MLQPYEGVVAAQTGHVSTHEAGAIEFTGHKVLTLPEKNGKICAADLKNLIETFYGDENHEHMVFPGMVYISHPTEYGTLYTKKELTELSAVCKEYKIPLFMDGARLIYGLVSKETDVTLQDIAKLCDVFYIGGTKAGALCGEAVVFTGDSMPKHFLTRVKQHGALLAKGRLTGVQFDALFTDDLYLEIGKNAIETAAVLKAGLKEKGYTFYIDSPTNQQFVVLENCKMEELKKDVQFSFWEKADDTHTIVRFATSWATRMEDVQKLLDADKTEISQEDVDQALENLNQALALLEKKDDGKDDTTVYKNGIYEGRALCRPDEDEEFTAYNLTLKVTVRDDKIVAVTDVKGDGDSSNDRYILSAANGISNKKGVTSQLIEKGNTEGIDAVSGATCTSKAILDACENALLSAKRQ